MHVFLQDSLITPPQTKDRDVQMSIKELKVTTEPMFLKIEIKVQKLESWLIYIFRVSSTLWKCTRTLCYGRESASKVDTHAFQKSSL